ncbi:MarR family winged helix-turn-helix transcriptional regulator [Dyella psychrodurans]|uniref:MarR family transcriptional regulator n=1 Tax=Dyella psychrodurans TaxID=1927960 RepID=A0A370XDP9_9GAMM|nr:MarR family transcriptional regulator [Dyella psychrodurans]RDS86553.1 MarR family transcriptional regulator [Dyella psychrodurans]
MSLLEKLKRLDEGIARVRQAIPEVPEDAALCRVLLLVGERLKEQFESRLKPFKLNDSEFRTLMMLFSRPDGSSTPGELCEFTSQGATNMTRIADALTKRGLITRGPSAEDRRRVVVRITAAGRRFVQKMLPAMIPAVERTFVGFTDTDRRHLSRLLRKLADNISQFENEAGDPP